MKFIHRLGYYLGGFSIGLVFLAFFLSGKRTSCDYGPNARTVKNILSKKQELSKSSQLFMDDIQMDSIQLASVISIGNVDFSKSDTQRDDCNIYFIESAFKEIPLNILVANCDSIATIKSIERKRD
ncbi:hypothetical protein SAMN03097699_1061 [Flavobacteriaceae bacterium MAR_2010_188]|nr:hypothetical protein SAMN03097699_1061 [Flavobacteriaceae bacterium MAR_2010_188]